MRCSKCGAENREGRKFCRSCGSKLGMLCPKCGAANEPGENFCGDCGAELGDPAQTAARDDAPVTLSATVERRHLTVLFCDLVGSTEIAARLDPEEWREIVASYHHAVTQAVNRFGGYVSQYLGDGVMAYFGWPEAHDNNAERAAHASLAIIDAVSRLNENAERPKLSARVGIDSGAVVVGASAGKSADVFGETPNIAARVQAAAAPATVLVTSNTHRLLEGLFEVEDRGTQTLKGIEQPVHLFRVVQPSGVRGRLEALASERRLTPFVGRKEELRLLMNRWERVREGEGQVVTIIGEAGIGKSRLVRRFHEQIQEKHTWIEATARAFFQNTPFYQIGDLIKQFLTFKENNTPEANLARLERGPESSGLKLTESIPLIAPLVNLAIPAKYSPRVISSEQERHRLLSTLVEWVVGAARLWRSPLAIVTEDLQWADPSTLELFALLVQRGVKSRLLLLYTARPEFRASWPLLAHHTQIAVSRLSARNVRSMIEEIAAHDTLSNETIETVIERTGGVPLFVEELTRAVLERGNAKFSGHQIPVTLHDSLMARLDRLGPAKEVIQIGAVIGSEFSYELLHAVHPIPDEKLQGAIDRATDAELIYVRGIAPDARYQFKHALIRDAAYEALLKSRRRELHRLVARTIDENFPSTRNAHPELLARHWTEAGDIEPAITEWSRAGRAAEARGAFKEALENYRQAVSMLDKLPPVEYLRELDLRESVIHMLWMTKGYSSPETIEAVEHGAALAEKSGNLADLAGVLGSRWTALFAAGDLCSASALADQSLELAYRNRDPISLAGAHGLQLITRHARGDLAGCEIHFAAGLRFFEPKFVPAPAGVVINLGVASWNAWFLGRFDLAIERESQMIEAANSNDPFEVGNSMAAAAFLRALARDSKKAQRFATRAVEIADEHHFGWLAANARCFLGFARAQLGRASEGVGLLREGLVGLSEIGTSVGAGR
jgi:class 3 adenylate cyclase/tetratricopeptide (TPR) repeat protein